MRKFILSIALLATVVVAEATDVKWAMVTQTGQTIFMSEVGYILYSDGSSVMSIVKTDNSAIEDVTEVKFVQQDPTGISQTVAGKGISLLSRAVDDNLTITGCAEGQTVMVVSASGVVVAKTRTNGEQTHVDVSHLATGMYILQVGKTTIKFMKK